MCLAGGRTPEPVYRELASASSIDWTRVDVFFGDERAVPPDHPDSNYLMVHRVLLSRVPVPAGQVHRMEAERSDQEAAAREYERSLPPQLDILVLGMGPDGHTASLFPGSAALDEHQRLVVPVIGAKPPPQRLTITPPVIEAARRVAVIATGGDKAAMVPAPSKARSRRKTFRCSWRGGGRGFWIRPRRDGSRPGGWPRDRVGR